jgi:glycerol-3-phosphate dehydrogenase (NAD(P)+)
LNLAIVGGGGWGTALAIVLAPRAARLRLWVHEPDLAARMASTRENDVFLPGCLLPPAVEVVTSLEAALEGANIVLGVMPSRHARGLYQRMLPYLDPAAILVSATKGLESGTLLRMSEVIEETVRERFQPRVAVLSGPTFAREVARGDPTVAAVASRDAGAAAEVQRALSGASFRLYTNTDPVGVEIGAALKNVIAIGAGICHGLNLGHNTLAALITRGLAEIMRLAVQMGGRRETLAGLAGLGDLVLTCTGELSRNRRVGMELAAGRKLEEIAASMRMVAEGVETCASAVALGVRHGVELPIIQQMHAVLRGEREPRASLKALMERSLKEE